MPTALGKGLTAKHAGGTPALPVLTRIVAHPSRPVANGVTRSAKLALRSEAHPPELADGRLSGG